MNDITNYEQLAMDWLKTTNPGLDDLQQKQFLMFCQVFRLNPWKKEAYAVTFRNKDGGVNLTLVTSYEVILARAMSNPKYYRYCLEYWQANKKLESPALTPNMRGVVIRVNIYDRDNNLLSSNNFNVDENAAANRGSFKNSYYQSWAEKCALTNAFRRTFPSDVAGLYIPEEMPAQNESVSVTKDNSIHPKIAPAYVECKQYIKAKISDRTKQAQVLGEFANMNHLTKEDLENGNFEPNAFKEFVDGYADGEQTK